MHKKISRELNLQKTAVLTVLSNSLQILAALGALLLSLLERAIQNLEEDRSV